MLDHLGYWPCAHDTPGFESRVIRNLEVQPTQPTQVSTMDRPEDRELSLLAPNPSETGAQVARSFPTISIYDPLVGDQKVNLEDPVEKPIA
ncbi:hypothetical protein TELCIR_01031 [Teladorsagia circumcincta]|uniref:Uncharacterized protein n=1 Tax=Teladorsagia circumcincta TaxID=45464 RepID=A0A2G9V306_TELCI|nr:hypothetical protein TELCIR_01031 [Teladorsagia circumcincta]